VTGRRKEIISGTRSVRSSKNVNFAGEDMWSEADSAYTSSSLSSASTSTSAPPTPFDPNLFDRLRFPNTNKAPCPLRTELGLTPDNRTSERKGTMTHFVTRNDSSTQIIIIPETDV
jgi:hypothetical protein